MPSPAPNRRPSLSLLQRRAHAKPAIFMPGRGHTLFLMALQPRLPRRLLACPGQDAKRKWPSTSPVFLCIRSWRHPAPDEPEILGIILGVILAIMGIMHGHPGEHEKLRTPHSHHLAILHPSPMGVRYSKTEPRCVHAATVLLGSSGKIKRPAAVSHSLLCTLASVFFCSIADRAGTAHFRHACPVGTLAVSWSQWAGVTTVRMTPAHPRMPVR